MYYKYEHYCIKSHCRNSNLCGKRTVQNLLENLGHCAGTAMHKISLFWRVSTQTYDPLLFPLKSMADLIGALFFFFHFNWHSIYRKMCNLRLCEFLSCLIFCSSRNISYWRTKCYSIVVILKVATRGVCHHSMCSRLSHIGEQSFFA